VGEDAPHIDPAIVRFYSEQTAERDRLRYGRGQLEFIRTQELLRGVLPSPRARVLDVGGGPGEHSAWLARDGYDVKLLDPVPALVEQARETAGRQPEARFEVENADARALPEPDGSADGVLLLGPLYHLQERADRLRALTEAWRVLRPGGVVAVSVISRFTTLLDTMRKGALDDETLARLQEGSLRTGRHEARHGFTTAYFHRPTELREELAAAGFEDLSLRPIEGPGWLLLAGELDPDRETPPRPELLAAAVRCARALESADELLDASSHVLGIGFRPQRSVES
jgi:SAM-dependent methyltransferase